MSPCLPGNHTGYLLPGFWWPTIYFNKSLNQIVLLSYRSPGEACRKNIQLLKHETAKKILWEHFTFLDPDPLLLLYPDPDHNTHCCRYLHFCSVLCRISNQATQVGSLAIFPVERTCLCLCWHRVCQTSGRDRKTSERDRQTSGRGRQTSGGDRQSSGRDRQTSGQGLQTSGRNCQTSGQMHDMWCRVRLPCQHKQPPQASTEVPTEPDRLGGQ